VDWLREGKPAQTQTPHSDDNCGGNPTARGQHPRTTGAGLEETIPTPDYCSMLETRTDSDPGTYITHSLQNPAGHWIGSFETPRRISKCSDQLYVKVDPEPDKQSRNCPKELPRYGLTDSSLLCRSFRTVCQVSKK